MKKIIFSITLILFVVKSFSQTPSGQLSKDYYLTKSKNQKTTAWILLVGGTLMVVGGAISFGDNYYYGSDTATDVSGFIVLGGLLSDIASIPFFISSSKNKKRAVAIAFNRQNMLVPQHTTLVLKSQPTVTLKIRF